MIKKTYIFALIVAAVIGFSRTDADAQNRLPDKEINYNVRFVKGKASAVYKSRIPLGTSHIYKLRAREGQDMTVILTTGKQTVFTVYSINSGVLEGADGETMWRGRLADTGEYLIVVGTDKTTGYTLEIYVK